MRELDELTVYAISAKYQTIRFVEPGVRGRPRRETGIAPDVACMLAQSWPDCEASREARPKEGVTVWRVHPVFACGARRGHIEFRTRSEWDAEAELAEAWEAAGVDARERLAGLSPLTRARELREALMARRDAESDRAERERRRAEMLAARNAKKAESRDESTSLAKAILAARNGSDFATERTEGAEWRKTSRVFNSSRAAALQRLLDPRTRMLGVRQSASADANGWHHYRAMLESDDGDAMVVITFRAPPLSALLERRELAMELPKPVVSALAARRL
ncbi:MAG: hypothetical protein ACO1PB_04650 [Ramlibacter sp.]